MRTRSGRSSRRRSRARERTRRWRDEPFADGWWPRSTAEGWHSMAARRLVGHQAYVKWGTERILSLADLVPSKPTALFVGYNPRPESVLAGHYYQGTRGKQFWGYLVRAKFIRHPAVGQFHDDLMYEAGYGLSDIVKRPGKHAEHIEYQDLNTGRPILLRKIQEWHPKIVCSVFKGALEKVLEQPLTWGFNSVEQLTQPVFAIPFPPGKYVRGERILASLAELGKWLDVR